MDMPTQGNPKLTIRMDRETRARFIAAAYNAGTTGSDLVTDFIHWWLGEQGAELPQRPEEPAMATTTEYGYWADHSKLHRDLRGDVLDFLGGQDAGFDVDGLTAAYEEAINQALPDDISLRGYNFYGPFPRRDGSFEEIEAAIESVDLGELAEKFDRSIEGDR